ncbi:MAG TPA: CocE/NonD family hydrolase [Actinomycetota bacterium]|nr:CocE/NonD family hydrolase [Actinomycetota bacterium]
MALVRRLLALFVAVSFLAAPALASGGSKRWSPERWRKTLSQPRYSGFDRSNYYIEAKDGTQLSLTVFLPKGLEAGKKIPTLLEISPYQPLDRGLNPRGLNPDWLMFVERGAAYVEADARGTMGSEGCLDFGGSADRSDAKVFAQWIRKQEWSNDVIVSDGVSHPGMGSVVAHTSVPDLTAALAHAPVVSYYQDEWLQGAKFEDQFNGPLYEGIEMVPSTYPDPQAVTAQASTCRGQTTLDFSRYEGPFTEKWADRDLSRHTPKAQIPVLLTHGFVDLNVHPDHSQMYWDALPDDYPKYGIFGWWYHGWPDMTGYPGIVNFDEIRHRWLDTALFGKENGLKYEPRLLVEDSKGMWHEGDDWPLEPSEWVTFYPDEQGGFGARRPQAGEVSYVDDVPSYRHSWTDSSAVFRSRPLSAPRMINGQPTVHLEASSNQTSTKWVAYLIDEAPDGSWERISHGYADSHTWRKEHEWLEMEPGKTYEWDLELQPTAVVLDKGHRVVLVVTSQDSRKTDMDGGCFSDYRGRCYNPSGILPAVTAGRATNTIEVGPRASSVSFAWVDPRRTQKPPWQAP